MPHLTIFGMNYAPEITGNAPYTTAVAEHVASSGWDVDVHTGYPHYPEWRKWNAAATDVSNGVTITRHRHSVPSTPTTLGRAMMDFTWAATSARSARRQVDTDMVMAVIPHLAEPWLALVAARRSKAPLIIWFQDLMGRAAAQSGLRGGSSVAGIVQRTELSIARRADAVIVAADGFRRHLIEGGVEPDRIRVVRNWSLLEPSNASREQARASFGFSTDQVVAVHSGNMGAKQGLGVVLDAAAAAPTVTWVLQGNGSERRHLERHAATQELENVVFLPSLGSEDLANLLIAADVLVLTQRDSVTDMSVPSKLTTYLSVNRPIVASVNRASEAASLLSAASRGTVVEPEDGPALASEVRSAATRSPEAPMGTPDLFGSPGEIGAVLREHLCMDAHG